MTCSAWFTVILVDGAEKTITVDGEEVLLRIAEATHEEQPVSYTVAVDYVYLAYYRYAKVSWSFDCYIKDIHVHRT